MRNASIAFLLLALSLPAFSAQYLERVESPVYKAGGPAELLDAKAKDCLKRIETDGTASAKFTSMLVPYEVTSSATVTTSEGGARVIFDNVTWRRGGGPFEKVGKWAGSGWQNAEKALLAQADVFGRCLASGGAPEAATRKAFDTLKSLAGTWTLDDGSGKTAQDTFELAARSDKGAAGATAVVEKNAGFVAVYHPDGDSVMVTLYAEDGNQPRLRAKEGTLDFTFVDLTNGRPGVGHMSALSIERPDASRVVETWSFTGADGQIAPVKLTLTRKAQ